MKKVKATYRFACVVTAKFDNVGERHDWTHCSLEAWEDWKAKMDGLILLNGNVVVGLEATEYEDGTISIE